MQIENMKYTILLMTLLNGMQTFALSDSSNRKSVSPIISMEIESFSIEYGSTDKLSKSSPSYRSTSIFFAYLPVYKNWGLVPIAGYNFYYWNDKYNTRDRHQYKGIYYGLGIEKKFRINESSNFGMGIQKIYKWIQYESNQYPTSRESSNVWRFRLTGNTQFYRKWGLTSSLNFVYKPNSANRDLYVLGYFRDINFSFGFTFNLKNNHE